MRIGHQNGGIARRAFPLSSKACRSLLVAGIRRYPALAKPGIHIALPGKDPSHSNREPRRRKASMRVVGVPSLPAHPCAVR
jgi:hypothetical protein